MSRVLILIGLILGIGATSAYATPADSSCVNVEFKGLVLVSKIIEGRSYERIYATVRISNGTSKELRIAAEHCDGRYSLAFGREALVHYQRPKDSSWRWEKTIEAVSDGGARTDRLLIGSGDSAVAYVDWSPSLLVDFPADTKF